MSAPRLARGAAKVLAKEDVAERTVSEKERARTIDAIRGALAARAQRRARSRWLAPLAAAAAILVVSGAAWSWRRSPVVATAPVSHEENLSTESVRGAVYVARGGTRVLLESHAAVASGESVSAVDGDAVFALRSGTKIDVERGTEVAMVADGATELVRLERGAVTSRVAKLHGSQRFIVRTADADVEVRGTVFRVSRLSEPECGERTRVRVEEGRVVVRAPGGGITLDPGGDWASPCIAPAQPAPPATAKPTTTQAAAEAPGSRIAAPPSPRSATPAPVATLSLPSASADPPRPAVSAPSPASELTAQNALFAEAMSAKSRGEPAKAVTALDALLQKYPRTPLREAAEAQRMNLLVGIDRGRATALAKDYLARYPLGFARADADAIARDAP